MTSHATLDKFPPDGFGIGTQEGKLVEPDRWGVAVRNQGGATASIMDG
jgi:hypothetical protein